MSRTLAALLALSALGCGSGGGDRGGGFGSPGGAPGSGGTAPGTGGTTMVGAGAGGEGAGGSGTGGGISLGGNGGGPSGEGGCVHELPAVIRDFTEAHPDFESFNSGVVKGLVAPDLGADGKPIHAAPGPTQATSGPMTFGQWYRDIGNGVNATLGTTIVFAEPSPGTYVYDNSSFFPIDNQGFGNGPVDILSGLFGGMAAHNFLFTTEIHTQFTYEGGENFTFRGDDDLWIFINNKLAIDLGGVHGASEETIQMDTIAITLGIVVGSTYPMDIFHAERHTVESNFRIETTIRCFTPVDVR